MNARNAPAVTLVFGVLLILLAVGFFVATGSSHFTALIPAAIGLPMAVAGGLAFKDNLRMHAVHAALIFALFGVIGTLMRLPKIFQGGVALPAVVEILLMGVICVVFIVLGVRSFINARRDRAAAAAQE